MGKTIVITGAGAGLGKALARRFAGEGETVILLGRTLSKVQALAQELGGGAMAVECDVANADSVRGAFAAVARVHPRINVLINNAAVYEPFAVAEATDHQIDSIIATNLNGPVYCCRSAIPMMEAGAQIINVGSESIALPFGMLSIYQASKAGFEMFSQALETELVETGIRVTMVRAGQMYDESKESSGWDREVGMRFYAACAKNGLDLRSRPVSHTNSVTDVFRAVLDLPPDVKLSLITVGARKP